MRKVPFLLGITAILLCLAACSSRTLTAIELLGAERIAGIEIQRYAGDALRETSAYTGSRVDFLARLAEGSEPSARESVNDRPAGAEEYYALRFYEEAALEPIFVAWVYADRQGKKWIEQPYVGVWLLSDEVYNRVLDSFNH